ncbi:AI-2E family transporter [Oscillatoria acuminata]|uniref:Putative permease n=1 Tax=Oscillatoria acuminata PCC 6304 TaxID=56110 RepID=K9TMU0_9CYAN|nr:AI-2E family transporter [Oscillatoria acuminata]AFY84182.1 putative permease [Oscillatoria acuminata PCC 6304]
MSKPSRQNLWSQLNNYKLFRYLLLLTLGWAIIQVLGYFQSVIVIFIFAAILAFLLNYPVKWIQRWVPHNIAVILVFLASLIMFGGLAITLGVAVLSQGQQLLEQSPELLQSLLDLLDYIQEVLARRNLQLDLTAIEDRLREEALAGIGVGLMTVQKILSNLVDLILIAVVAFFMLLDGRQIWDLFLKLFPSRLRSNVTLAIQKNFLGFFWGRLILSVFFAVSCFVVFVILDIPYALILAAVGGFFDLIPGIGATLGISLISLILLPQGIWLSIKVLVTCILLQQVEENLLMPRIMKDSININPVIMFLALLIGARVAGLLGIFLAIPISGVLISLGDFDDMKGDK